MDILHLECTKGLCVADFTGFRVFVPSPKLSVFGKRRVICAGRVEQKTRDVDTGWSVDSKTYTRFKVNVKILPALIKSSSARIILYLLKSSVTHESRLICATDSLSDRN